MKYLNIKKAIICLSLPVLILSGCKNTATDPQLKPAPAGNTMDIQNDDQQNNPANNNDNDNEIENENDLAQALQSTVKQDEYKQEEKEKKEVKNEEEKNNTEANSDGDDKAADTGTNVVKDNKTKTPLPFDEPPKENNNPNDNSPKSWGFVRDKNHQPPVAQQEINLTAYDAYYLGDTSEKVIYLTFDQGYENGLTGKILDTLKEHDVKAAFFCVGTYIKTEADLIKRMVDEGHIVGNHSYNHPSFPKISDEKIKQEIEETEKIYTEVTGQQMPKYFRPPSGEYSQKSLEAIKNLGYKTIFWSFAYKDWEVDNQPDPAYTLQMVMDNYHNGCIMLLHSVSQANADALGDCIKGLKEKGYVFKSLDEYF